MFQKLSSMKSALRAVTAVAVLGSASMGAMACGDTPYIGQVCTFAFDFCPEHFVPAHGQLLPVSQQQYNALFALLGTRYGGDGRITFGLPDLRGRTVVGAGQPIPTITDMPATILVGQNLGKASTRLAVKQIPLHSVLIPAGALNGNVELNLAGASVSGQIITGSVTVEGLNGDAAPTGALNVPTATANTVGRNGFNQQFYSSGTTKIALPSRHNLGVSGGVVVSGTASGTMTMPAYAILLSAGTAVTDPVLTVQPSLGLTQCIAIEGLFPPRS